MTADEQVNQWAAAAQGWLAGVPHTVQWAIGLPHAQCTNAELIARYPDRVHQAPHAPGVVIINAAANQLIDHDRYQLTYEEKSRSEALAKIWDARFLRAMRHLETLFPEWGPAADADLFACSVSDVFNDTPEGQNVHRLLTDAEFMSNLMDVL